ncbi:2Fe-2S iron-sulfur cluster-binding protein [Microaceticoccus formicicus]|uniref:2Fe-2S iron-sulfur cluster-binding protein n=1 Tax=Microaceticoccus formicicus TaxID=3118105 RepID=UPI003CD04112|nr:2Fe-2S iron-sulfur cluster-binding protein [Peptoniphilaceae bacterium AMB_02]
MFNLNVNRVEYQHEEDLKLIDYLREVLKLKGVKDGCAAGACGACSVIADGKLIRACIMKLSKLEGKKIITIEGLSERERDVYGYAFAKAGAVQCGFCIPGMVMAAKVLIDVNNNPARDEIKKAIRGNICRCTGYIKIIDAIEIAAELIRTGNEVPENTDTGAIGERTMRVDAIPKTIGTAKYADDYEVEGMVYGKAIRPPAARCKVLSIDPSKALEMDGVIGVYTADDIPGDRYIGHLQKDYPVMIAVGEETRFIGDAVALIVTETKEMLEEAAGAVEIEYEELPPVNNPFEAMKDDAPQIHGEGFKQFGSHYIPVNNVMSHQALKRGDVVAAFARSKYFSEHTFQVPFTEHAFMEPGSCSCHT